MNYAENDVDITLNEMKLEIEFDKSKLELEWMCGLKSFSMCVL